MEFIWDVKPLANIIIESVLITFVFAFLIFVFASVVKRKGGYWAAISSYVLAAIGYVFNLLPLFITAVGIGTVAFSIILFANLGDLRNFIANPFKRVNGKVTKRGVSKIYDRKALYSVIEETVKELSASKTGALMTFEKETNMEDFCKNGVLINAPVNKELLLTIFYTGTRLHDGAVVIRDDQILYASAFFTPSTRAFAGKYGSRHRAAIGISEVSDSVTVVVSEETGRISFAVNGQLETVDEENFLKAFENYMLDDESDE